MKSRDINNLTKAAENYLQELYDRTTAFTGYHEQKIMTRVIISILKNWAREQEKDEK